MNVTTFFSLISNVALFFMVIYFLFKIKPVKAAMIHHDQTQGEFVATIGLTIVFSIFNIFASVLGIQMGNAIANIRTGVVVVATGNNCRAYRWCISIWSWRMDIARLF